MKFEAGDRVKLDLNCTIQKIIEDNSHGCLSDTMDFIEHSVYKSAENKIYTVEDISWGNIEIDGKILNCNIFQLIERPKRKEMTMSEIEKELGYAIKILKED